VQQYLGTPEEIEELDEVAIPTLTWHYANLKLDLGFQQPLNGNDQTVRLISITTRSPLAVLWGTRIIGSTQNVVFSLFKEHGFDGFIQCGDKPDTLGFTDFRMDSIRVMLLFRQRLLRSVLWRSIGG
jgi:hypothetical protein